MYFKPTVVRYETRLDLHYGDGEYVFYDVLEVRQWLFFEWTRKINYAIQSEARTLCENLNKILETR